MPTRRSPLDGSSSYRSYGLTDRQSAHPGGRCDPDSDRRRAELFEADGGGIHPAQALAVLAAHGVAVPPGVRAYLETTPDCPGPDDPRMSRVTNQVIAAPQQSLEAAAAVAREAVVTPVVLGDSLEGQAREVGIVLAGITRQVLRHGQPAPAPCVLLSGGETTVAVQGQGRGGRNVELLLSLAAALRGAPGVHAIACDTDGVDGVEEIAGALVGPDTLRRARDLDVDAAATLADNDGHGFFAALGDQVVTGPTRSPTSTTSAPSSSAENTARGC